MSKDNAPSDQQTSSFNRKAEKFLNVGLKLYFAAAALCVSLSLMTHVIPETCSDDLDEFFDDHDLSYALLDDVQHPPEHIRFYHPGNPLVAFHEIGAYAANNYGNSKNVLQKLYRIFSSAATMPMVLAIDAVFQRYEKNIYHTTAFNIIPDDNRDTSFIYYDIENSSFAKEASYISDEAKKAFVLAHELRHSDHRHSSDGKNLETLDVFHESDADISAFSMLKKYYPDDYDAIVQYQIKNRSGGFYNVLTKDLDYVSLAICYRLTEWADGNDVPDADDAYNTAKRLDTIIRPAFGASVSGIDFNLQVFCDTIFSQNNMETFTQDPALLSAVIAYIRTFNVEFEVTLPQDEPAATPPAPQRKDFF